MSQDAPRLQARNWERNGVYRERLKKIVGMQLDHQHMIVPEFGVFLVIPRKIDGPDKCPSLASYGSCVWLKLVVQPWQCAILCVTIQLACD